RLEIAHSSVTRGARRAGRPPGAFRWPMKAKVEHGAKIVHVDPRFTRTSAMADVHAPVRAGTDIGFLGGLINYVLSSRRWNTDPFFREYVVNYTNAATIGREDFKDADEGEGAFSGLMEYSGNKKDWPFDGFVGEYNPASWQYAREWGGQAAGRRDASFDSLIRSLRQAPPLRDEPLRHPRTVFQLIKRHFSRYTPEMVQEVTGCPKDAFVKVAETVLENSGRERTTAWVYAVGWTQHTYGPQMIG